MEKGDHQKQILQMEKSLQTNEDKMQGFVN